MVTVNVIVCVPAPVLSEPERHAHARRRSSRVVAVVRRVGGIRDRHGVERERSGHVGRVRRDVVREHHVGRRARAGGADCDRIVDARTRHRTRTAQLVDDGLGLGGRHADARHVVAAVVRADAVADCRQPRRSDHRYRCPGRRRSCPPVPCRCALRPKARDAGLLPSSALAGMSLTTKTVKERVGRKLRIAAGHVGGVAAVEDRQYRQCRRCRCR